MIISDTIQSAIRMMVEDFKEHSGEYLRFLFVETPTGWIGVGIGALLTFMTVSTILYWI